MRPRRGSWPPWALSANGKRRPGSRRPRCSFRALKGRMIAEVVTSGHAMELPPKKRPTGYHPLVVGTGEMVRSWAVKFGLPSGIRGCLILRRTPRPRPSRSSPPGGYRVPSSRISSLARDRDQVVHRRIADPVELRRVEANAGLLQRLVDRRTLHDRWRGRPWPQRCRASSPPRGSRRPACSAARRPDCPEYAWSDAARRCGHRDCSRRRHRSRSPAEFSSREEARLLPDCGADRRAREQHQNEQAHPELLALAQEHGSRHDIDDLILPWPVRTKAAAHDAKHRSHPDDPHR